MKHIKLGQTVSDGWVGNDLIWVGFSHNLELREQ